jgi:hypothetical protein
MRHMTVRPAPGGVERLAAHAGRAVLAHEPRLARRRAAELALEAMPLVLSGLGPLGRRDVAAAVGRPGSTGALALALSA